MQHYYYAKNGRYIPRPFILSTHITNDFALSSNTFNALRKMSSGVNIPVDSIETKYSNYSTYEVVWYFAESYIVKFDAFSACCAIPWLGNYNFIFLLAKNLSRTAINEFIGIFLMIEFRLDGDIWHQTVEASWHWWPFSMFFAYPPLSIDFEIDLLIFAKFGNQNTFMNEAYFQFFCLLISLRYPLELFRID